MTTGGSAGGGRPATLRILYSFPHGVGTPGIGTTALHQVRSLSEAGAEVTLVCTSLHAELPARIPVLETLRFRGRRIPHRALGSADRALAYHDRRVAALLLHSPGGFDVVHTWPQSALQTMAEARRQGCLSSREVPNTHTAHAYAQAAAEADIVGVGLRRHQAHRPDARHLRIEQREYDEADLLLVPSDHSAQTFLDRGVPAARLRRHRYGFDPARFSATGRVEWPTRPFTAVFVGTAEPRKGLHYALDAWARTAPPPGSTFLIAGRFVPGYEQYLGPRLRLRGVERLGFVEDVPSLLRASDVLLLPSVEEGSALVSYEAQASGCIPLVSTAAGAVLPAGLTRFLHQPRDVATLTSQLRSLAHDEDLRGRLRQEMLGWASEITWQAAGEKQVQIYREALSSD